MRDILFSVRLKNLRKSKNLSQFDLAQILEVSQRIISNWEKGEANPQWNMYEKIALFFNVSINFLFGIDDETQKIINAYKEKKFEDIRQNKDDFETYTFNKLNNEFREAENNFKTATMKNLKDVFINVCTKQDNFENFIYSNVMDKLINVKYEEYKPQTLEETAEIAKKIQH